jgi:hypothetical protein
MATCMHNIRDFEIAIPITHLPVRPEIGPYIMALHSGQVKTAEQISGPDVPAAGSRTAPGPHSINR